MNRDHLCRPMSAADIRRAVQIAKVVNRIGVLMAAVRLEWSDARRLLGRA